MSARERRARAAELLDMVGISADRLGSYPHQLSGGMRQRVMIAMALGLEPQVVIMDEPTTALDVVTQREILEELTELRDRLGFAILFITHDLSLLIEIADTIAVMYAGRVVEQAQATALFRSPRHPYTLGLLSSFPSLHGPRRRMTGIPGSPPDLRELPSGMRVPPALRVRAGPLPYRRPGPGPAAGRRGPGGGLLAARRNRDGPRPAGPTRAGRLSPSPTASGARCDHARADPRGPPPDQALRHAPDRPPGPDGSAPGRADRGARRRGRLAGPGPGPGHRRRRRERLGQVHAGPDAGPADLPTAGDLLLDGQAASGAPAPVYAPGADGAPGPVRLAEPGPRRALPPGPAAAGPRAGPRGPSWTR